MKRDVCVHESLYLTISHIEDAMRNVNEEGYWLDVCHDDMYNIVINPHGQEIDGRYTVYKLDDRDNLLLKSVTFQEYLDYIEMTGYKLSKLSGVPQSTISDLMTGKSDIRKASWETVQKICKALDITVDMLNEIIKD